MDEYQCSFPYNNLQSYSMLLKLPETIKSLSIFLIKILLFLMKNYKRHRKTRHYTKTTNKLQTSIQKNIFKQKEWVVRSLYKSNNKNMKEKKALIIIPENEWFPATASKKEKRKRASGA